MNDIVLDFFAGSGTTLAVAHKMNRKYIGIDNHLEYSKYERNDTNNSRNGHCKSKKVETGTSKGGYPYISMELVVVSKDGDKLFVVAVGNDGELPDELGRIQSPADGVNCLGVGAYTKNYIELIYTNK